MLHKKLVLNSRRKSGPAKGARQERKIAKRLNQIFGEDVLWRTAGSGAKATVTGSSVDAGDIGARHKDGHGFVTQNYVEIKARELTLRDVVSILYVVGNSEMPQGKISKWWADTKTKAAASDKVPILMVQIPYVDYVVIYQRPENRVPVAETLGQWLVGLEHDKDRWIK